MSGKTQDLQNALDLLSRSLNVLGGEKEREAVVSEWFMNLHRTSQQATGCAYTERVRLSV
jgi:hypothetical protein